MKLHRRVVLLFGLLALLAVPVHADVGPYAKQNYTPAGGVATNASWVGPWTPILRNGAIGFQVVMTGTGAPVGAWGADITDDDNPVTAPYLSATALTLTADQLAVNPAGDSAAVNFLFYFAPAPPARWMRFKYTRTSGGSASLLLKIGVSTSPPGQ